MLAWLLRRLTPPLAVSPSAVPQRLQAAKRLIQERGEPHTPDGTSRERSSLHTCREILPSDEQGVIVSYRLPGLSPASPELAAALESVLQGRRVTPIVFTQLYRRGFVFKDPHGRWTITALGKDLIERNKLFTAERCLVAGVECAGGWGKRDNGPAAMGGRDGGKS